MVGFSLTVSCDLVWLAHSQAVIDKDVMIAQNCGSCGYKGMPLLSILGATKPVRWNESGWVIVEAA